MKQTTLEAVNDLLISEIEHAGRMIERHKRNIEDIKKHTPKTQQEFLIKNESERIAYHMTMAQKYTLAFDDLNPIKK